MDLLSKLDNELSVKHFNDFEKVRYIYLRTCELFSFDARYNFTYLFNDDEFYKQIINGMIDIRNINNFLVVCHSYSRDILLKLIRELTAAKVEIISGKHSYVSYYHNGYVWQLDATLGDMPRVKLNLSTRGFTSMDKNSNNFLNETDLLLGYNSTSKLEYIKQIDISSTTKIFNGINLILQNSKCKNEFSDATFLVEYLLFGINFYEFYESIYVGDGYDFHQIFSLLDGDNYFCLDKEHGHYELYPMIKDDCLKLTRNLRTNKNILK